jgi:hypothetical protein
MARIAVLVLVLCTIAPFSLLAQPPSKLRTVADEELRARYAVDPISPAEQYNKWKLDQYKFHASWEYAVLKTAFVVGFAFVGWSIQRVGKAVIGWVDRVVFGLNTVQPTPAKPSETTGSKAADNQEPIQGEHDPAPPR